MEDAEKQEAENPSGGGRQSLSKGRKSSIRSKLARGSLGMQDVVDQRGLKGDVSLNSTLTNFKSTGGFTPSEASRKSSRRRSSQGRGSAFSIGADQTASSAGFRVGFDQTVSSFGVKSEKSFLKSALKQPSETAEQPTVVEAWSSIKLPLEESPTRPSSRPATRTVANMLRPIMSPIPKKRMVPPKRQRFSARGGKRSVVDIAETEVRHFDRDIADKGSFADRLGEHTPGVPITQRSRLTGTNERKQTLQPDERMMVTDC
eukprot:TRINITY_DN905_c1_g1_i1.p1 TRINITY_DN905_c1_g1~~TRINITY_DN905_c1_g1_i1.p1  ORF type:complete len:289 (-),score=36.09 TRINITY_DN905_c1_g1_i1:97-876(-)